MDTENSARKSLGDWGEETAAAYLEEKGLKVVARHYQQKWGEIDLICLDRNTWVFVEVKTRSSVFEPSAVDSVTPRKKQRIIRAAVSYLKWKGLMDSAIRFDL